MRPQSSPVQSESIASIRLIILFAVYVLLIYLSLFNQQRIELVPRFFLGLDFHDFFRAALEYASGNSPYEIARFVTPPPSLLPALFLQWFSFDQAVAIWFVANLCFIVTGICMACRSSSVSSRNTALCILFAFASYPVQMLIERGNIDGLIFLGLAVCLFSENRIAIGFAFSTILLSKIYPILMAPYFLFRKRKAITFILIFVVGYIAIFNHHFVDYLPSLLKRGSQLRFDENISPNGIFVLIAEQTQLKAAGLFYWLAVPFLLLSYVLDACLLRSKGAEDYQVLIMSSCLMPMLFFPKLVYAYSGVILLLLFIAIDRFDDRFTLGQKVAIALVEVAIMFPTVGFSKVVSANWFHLIPQCGLLILATMIIGWKADRVWHWLKRDRIAGGGAGLIAGQS